MGGIFSLLLTAVSFGFAVLKINHVLTRNDTTYLYYESDSFFELEQFTSDDGFAVAFAFTSYDENQYQEEDPDYGTLQAFHYEWGMDGQKR